MKRSIRHASCRWDRHSTWPRRTTAIASTEGRSRLLVFVPLLLASLLNAGGAGAQDVDSLTATDKRLEELDTRWPDIQNDPEVLSRWQELLKQRLVASQTCIAETRDELSMLEQAAPAEAAAAEGEGLEPFRQELSRLQQRLIACRVSESRISEWQRRVTESLARARTAILIQPAGWWKASTHWPDALPWMLLTGLVLALLPLARRRLPDPFQAGSLGQLAHPVVATALLALPALGTLLLSEPATAWSASLDMAAIVLLLALTLGFIDSFPARRAATLWTRPELWLYVAGIAAAVLLLATDGPWPLPLEGPVEWNRPAGLALLTLHASWMLFLLCLNRNTITGPVLGLWIAMGTMGTALAMLGLLLGRPNLSMYLATGVIGTSIAVLAGRWLYLLIDELIEGLDQGRTRSQRWVRRTLGVQAGDPIPASSWLRITAELLIILGLIMLVMIAWRAPLLGIAPLPDLLRGGIPVGAIDIVPYDIVFGVLVFTVLMVLTQRGKRLISHRLVQRGRVGMRSADAIVTVLGYVGIILAAIVGLTVAGFSMGNLALIAGALSVGIGFGLQNVVNNFVSGLILLFERPVKAGDWIRLENGTEGFVQRVRVRSTEIQGFDRSEIIVPNSEMISATVVNMTLHDGVGRVIVPVGVAYGSDVERVRDVLLEVAHAHPLPIKAGELEPRALFLAFGDSSLNFELRVYLPDVMKTILTRSELHFAIDRAFREAGIEIPFPQRTVHLRGET